jgi:hypothetical protein
MTMAASTLTMAAVQELGRDVEDLTKTPASDAFFFNPSEREILNLWDEEQEIELEIALLRAQRDDSESLCFPWYCWIGSDRIATDPSCS